MLRLVRVITAAGRRKKTADCFSDKSRFGRLDPRLIGSLPKYQPSQPASKFSVYKPTQAITIKQAIESFLCMGGEIKTLEAVLRRHHHVTTLPVIESLVESQDDDGFVGLRTDDSLPNLFFVEGKRGDILVVVVFSIRKRWDVTMPQLDDGYVWNEEGRFFFRDEKLS